MERKKMYKAKKRWLVASMIGVAGASMMATMDAHADTTNSQPSHEDAIDNINQAAANLNQNTASLKDQALPGNATSVSQEHSVASTSGTMETHIPSSTASASSATPAGKHAVGTRIVSGIISFVDPNGKLIDHVVVSGEIGTKVNQFKVPKGYHLVDPNAAFKFGDKDNGQYNITIAPDAESDANKSASSASKSNTPAKSASSSDADKPASSASKSDSPADSGNVVTTPDTAQHIFRFLDETEDGKVVSTQTVSGIVDQQMPVHVDIPKGFRLAEGQTIPQEVVLRAKVITTDVKLVHNVTTTMDYKTVKRTIETLNPITGKTSTQVQKHDFSRPKTTDMVTGKASYGSWSTAGEFTFDAVTIPGIPGYTPSMKKVGSLIVTPDSTDSTVTIKYDANHDGQVINLVDPSGSVIASQTLHGNAGEIKNVVLQIPKGWQIMNNQSVPRTVTLKDNADPLNIYIQQTTKNVNEEKSFIRTIIVTDPSGHQNTIKQVVQFIRHNKFDNTTGKTIDGDWELASDSDAWPAYTVPSIPGYDPSEAVVSAVTLDPNTATDRTVTVVYNAESMDQKIDYLDDTDGKLLNEETIGGKAGTIKGIKLNIPKGYELVKGQNIPQMVTFSGEKMAPIAVHLQHIIDKMPVTSTVKRVIMINPPKAKSQTITQTVSFRRVDQKDEVTGQVVTGKWDHDSLSFKAYMPTKIRGYEAQPSNIAQLTVHPGDKDTNVTVNYKAIDYHEVINLVDKTNGSILMKKTIVGHIGDTVNLNLDKLIPQNYTLAPYQDNLPDSVTFDDHDLDPLTVYLIHQTKDEQQTKDITRTINFHDPKTHAVTNTKVQHAKFSRTVTRDLVTNKITQTGAWDHDSITLPGINVDTYDQYSPKSEVKDWIVKPTDTNRTVDVDYGSKVDKVVVNYVDSNGKTIKSETLTGAPNSQGVITPNVPAGYQLVKGQEKMLNFTYGQVSEVDLLVEKTDTLNTDNNSNNSNNSNANNQNSATNNNGNTSNANSSTNNNGVYNANSGSSYAGNNGSSYNGNGSANGYNNAENSYAGQGNNGMTNATYDSGNATPDYSNMNDHQYAGAIANDIANGLKKNHNNKMNAINDSNNDNGNTNTKSSLPKTDNQMTSKGAEAFGLGLLAAATATTGLGVAKQRKEY